MAKLDGPRPETIEIPADDYRRLLARLEALEHGERIRHEQAANPQAKILDPAFEDWKRDIARPASVRTQEIADRMYQGPLRFRVWLDSTAEDGKPGPNISEHFPLEINAHSDLEAEARYLQIMSIRKHDYKLRHEPVALAS